MNQNELKKTNLITNFLKFYFDTEIFSEQEAKQELLNEGMDIQRIESKKKNYLKKLNKLAKFYKYENK